MSADGTSSTSLDLSDVLAMAPALLLALLIFAFFLFITDGDILGLAFEEGIGWLFRKARGTTGEICEGKGGQDGNSL